MKNGLIILIGFIVVILLAGSIVEMIKNMEIFAEFDKRISALERDANQPITLEELQRRLKDTGNPRYDPNLIDGIWGPQTAKAARNWEMDKLAESSFEGWRK
jgi:hypothetical protein